MRNLFILAMVMALLLLACNVAEPPRESGWVSGSQCLDPWDGNHNELEDLVKAQLRDPESMKTNWTKVGSVVQPNGSRVIIMEFRAANAFGGLAKHTAVGEFDDKTCDATLVSVSSAQ